MYEQAFKDLGITDEAQQQRYTALLIAIDAPDSLLGIVGVLNNILGAFESSWFENVLRDDQLGFFIRQTLDSALELFLFGGRGLRMIRVVRRTAVWDGAKRRPTGRGAGSAEYS